MSFYSSYYGSSRRRRRTYAIGDLNCKIKLQNRVLESQFQGVAAMDLENFKTRDEVWACVETVKGSKTFDDVEQKKSCSHTMVIRYRTDYLDFKWIEYKGKRFDVLDAENLDERDEFVMFKCALTGTNEPDNQGAWV